jgi:hypothetical protein
MASQRARECRARDEAERKCHDWREERDQDDDELPERDEPEPVHTLRERMAL